ncbi:DUF4224 domain-containing protein, partial [Xylella fastidiosa subsp. multiplex]
MPCFFRWTKKETRSASPSRSLWIRDMPLAAGLCLSRSEVAELCGTPQRARQAA